MIYVGRLHLATYQKLAAHSSATGTKLFKIRPKHHSYDHLLEHLTRSSLNPGWFSTVRDEDFLGKLKKLGQKCHGSSVMFRALQRYLMLMGLRSEQARRSRLWTRRENASHFVI